MKMTDLDYGRIFSTLSVKMRTTILRMLTVSIATGTSNDSCSDELTLPIRDWLFYYMSRHIERCIFSPFKTIWVTPIGYSIDFNLNE